MNNKIITIFGGTGFVGSHVINHLAKSGYLIRIICRNPDNYKYLKVCGDVAQIQLIEGDILQSERLKEFVIGSDVVINLVGVLFEKNNQNFQNIHVYAPRNLAIICKELNIKQYIYLSALGIEDNKSDYAKSKLFGEKKVQEIFPNATIIRPSIIFGREDKFLNKFIAMANGIMPFMPLIGEGKTKFQPVYVEDIAKLINVIIEKDIQGKIIEAAGPEAYSFKEILNLAVNIVGKNKYFIPISLCTAYYMGKILKYLPNPIFTDDQMISLKYDNILDPTSNNKKLNDFDIQPTSLKSAIKNYLNFKNIK